MQGEIWHRTTTDVIVRREKGNRMQGNEETRTMLRTRSMQIHVGTNDILVLGTAVFVHMEHLQIEKDYRKGLQTIVKTIGHTKGADSGLARVDIGLQRTLASHRRGRRNGLHEVVVVTQTAREIGNAKDDVGTD